MEGFAFAEEFGGEDEVGFALLGCVAYGHGGFDDHHCLRVDGQHVFYNSLYRLGIEVVGRRIVISRRGDDYVVCANVSVLLV